jgi:hypothetical protein
LRGVSATKRVVLLEQGANVFSRYGYSLIVDREAVVGLMRNEVRLMRISGTTEDAIRENMRRKSIPGKVVGGLVHESCYFVTLWDGLSSNSFVVTGVGPLARFGELPWNRDMDTRTLRLLGELARSVAFVELY